LSLHLSRLNFGLSQKKMKKITKQTECWTFEGVGNCGKSPQGFSHWGEGVALKVNEKMSWTSRSFGWNLWNKVFFFWCNFRGSGGNKCVSNGKTDDRWPAKRIRLPGFVKNRGTFLHWIFNFQNTNVWPGTLGMLAIMACQEYMCSPIWRTDWWAKNQCYSKRLVARCRMRVLKKVVFLRRISWLQFFAVLCISSEFFAVLCISFWLWIVILCWLFDCTKRSST